MPSLACVEDLAEHIVVFRLTREGQRLAKAACDHFAEELIFEAIVQEDRASFDIEQVREHLYEARQVELERVVEGDVPCDEEQAERVLDGLSGLQEEVVLSLPRPEHLCHRGDHAFSHEVRIEDG